MLELVRVKVADIFPLEDEYGNKFLSRDYDLPANKEYVSALAASFGPSGEPDEQIKLIRDGDVYRIKAGNSRVMAMRELGTEECWAVIDTDDTVQSVLETVVRTNTKKTYEPIEQSRFEQQLLLFGDDAYVSEVSRIGVEDVARMRRARQIAGEKAETYTLDKLFAIGEFDGDDDAVKQIEQATGNSLDAVVSRLRRERKQNEQRAAFEARAAELRIDIGSVKAGAQKFILSCDDPADLEADYMAAASDHTGIIGVIQTTWMGVQMSLYGKPMQDTEAERARAEELEALDAASKQAHALDEHIKEWIAGNLQSGKAVADAMPHLYAILAKRVPDSYQFDDVIDEYPFLADDALSRLDFAALFESWKTDVARAYRICALGMKEAWSLSTAKDVVECLDAYESDGWVPPEGSEAFVAKLRKITAEGDEE